MTSLLKDPPIESGIQHTFETEKDAKTEEEQYEEQPTPSQRLIKLVSPQLKEAKQTNGLWAFEPHGPVKTSCPNLVVANNRFVSYCPV